jgi:hypothetical protein
MSIEEKDLITATIFFRDSGIQFLDAEKSVDEDGSVIWRSTEFPFLVASAERDQDAVNRLACSAEDFLREVKELGDDATKDELLAAREIGTRLLDGFEAIDRREAQRRARARFKGRMRREMRGKWRHQFQSIGGRSPQTSRV